jgi:hypothetical protein
MKTKYDINQVPEEVLRKLGAKLLDSYQKSHLDGSYGTSYLNFYMIELVEASKVKLRTKAQIDAEIVETVRKYVEGNLFPGWGPKAAQKLNFLSNVPGTEVSFPKRIAELLAEETYEEVFTF